MISRRLLRTIEKRLSEGKRIRRTLPLNGRLHIDRTLPFLIVYRRPGRRLDPGTDRLVKGEAAYLIASGSTSLNPSLQHLIQTITETLSRKCKAFLIIEIWSAPVQKDEKGASSQPMKAGFQIFSSRSRAPRQTVEMLEKALGRIKIFKQSSMVEVTCRKKIWPKTLGGLLSDARAEELNCYLLGIEVQPIYRDKNSHGIYPMVLRTLHRQFARALKKAVFEFTLNHTTQHPPSFLSMGRRAVVKTVRMADRQMAEISHSFDFLLQVTPVNFESAWIKFRQGRYEKIPEFYYRPLPVDPILLKRELFKVPLNNIEDPTLAHFFREKRMELDRKLTMLLDIGRPAFLYGGIQVYGRLREDLLRQAKEILDRVPRYDRNGRGKQVLDAHAFAREVEKEIEFYRQSYEGFSGKVEVRHDTVGLMVSRGRLLVSSRIKIPLSRVEALIQHEIGTHMLTYFNGRAQSLHQLYCGMAGYEELQEGLAVLAEYLVDALSRPRLRLLAGRVVAAFCLIQGADFVDTYRELNREYGFKKYDSFSITFRIFRGGGLIKDAVYLRGLIGLLNYLRTGGELETLFIGKIATAHVPVIKELLYRRVLKSPPLYPRYLQYPGAREKLDRLKKGLTPLELIKRRKL